MNSSDGLDGVTVRLRTNSPTASVPWAAEPGPDIETLIPDRPDWWDNAACRGASVVMFPQPRYGHTSHALWAAALAYCADCPVVEPCRQAGEDGHETHGVWGGVIRQPARLHTITVASCLTDGEWWTFDQLVATCEQDEQAVRTQIHRLQARQRLDARIRRTWVEYRLRPTN